MTYFVLLYLYFVVLKLNMNYHYNKKGGSILFYLKKENMIP